MSGGSWDYAYLKVLEAASSLDIFNTADDEVRCELVKHMHELATVMKAIEWADSGDTAGDSWVEPLREFLTRHDTGYKQRLDERAAAEQAAREAGLTDEQIMILRHG